MRVSQPARIVIGLRAWMLAMPVANVIRSVASSNNAALANGSRPTDSGSQIVP